MPESLLAGLLLILTALPGIGLGAAILIGRFRPAQLAAARDPGRARVAVGGFLLGLNALIAVLGILLLATPPAQTGQLARWGVTAVLAVTALGLVPLLRAVRA